MSDSWNPSREEVIEGLKKVWDAFDHMEHDLYADYVFDALKMLKDQEPLVLTIEEVLACKPRKEWLWFEENAYGYIEESVMICAQIYTFGDSWIAVDVPSQTHDETIEFDNENYGKTWRCWSARPTDEQREAVPWQD